MPNSKPSSSPVNLPVLSSLQAPGPPQLLPCLCLSHSPRPSPTLLQGGPAWDSAVKKRDTIHCPPGDSLRMSRPLSSSQEEAGCPFGHSPGSGHQGLDWKVGSFRPPTALSCSPSIPSSYLTLGPDTCCLPSTPIAATLLEGSALPPCLSDLASQQERGGRVTRTLGPCYQPHTLPEHRAVPQRDAGFSSPSHEPLHLTRGLAIAL